MTDGVGVFESLRGMLGGRLKFHHSLAELTSFRSGGPADVYAEVATVEELKRVLALAASHGLPWMILGSGSNVLVTDKGVRGAVIKLSGAFVQVQAEGARVRAGGAVLLPGLAHATVKWGLTGLEWVVGIPGTVGGAVYMNAGVPEAEIKDRLVDIGVVTPDGREEVWPRSALTFRYRYSSIRERGVIVAWASFELSPETPAACEVKLREYLHKRTFQPLGAPNMGSMFKNPTGQFAGRLIEQAGLKGLRKGNVQVSPKHANFFVNLGGGTAAEALALIEEVRETVKTKTGVTLESEVLVVGER